MYSREHNHPSETIHEPRGDFLGIALVSAITPFLILTARWYTSRAFDRPITRQIINRLI